MADEMSAGGRLNDDDLRQLARLLARFAEHDLDQFEFLRVEVPGQGSVYVDIANYPRAQVSLDLYTTIWPLPAKLNE